MVGIIVKNYEHFNKALPNWHSPKGRYISSKKQYIEECKRAGLEPYREPEKREVKLKPNEDTISFLNSLRADKKGKVKLSDKQVDFMVSKGAIKDRDVYADKLPKHYMQSGGFN